MLSKIIGYITTAALSFLVGWVTKLIHSWQRQKAVEKQEQDSVDPLKKAKTGDEIDKATDDALGGL